ncbi:BTAD domain-containing putative transcriptional regulator [Streptomyces sp. NBS 14/10]|uniref:AfsR/SARP family transcriptional regulator n=1 Tax=Streptomyces sp. NBS 14/10 TaxID=1945643 RepID=UPI000B9CB3C3|nr:BTAD domain-containing putative transcriptional regulator [Streptomyces sp. NBS 14/10]KAK1185415.1 BTAD domain-containing putative transcriptional regulator [Streptomyces sp. NBS 14/10]
MGDFEVGTVPAESGADPGADPAEATGRLRIDLLGPVRARRGGAPLDIGPVRRQAVLAALMLRTETVVTHQQLLDDVWGTEPPGTGRRVLPSYVYPLRKALDVPGARPAESLIRGEHGGYRFVPGGARTDIAQLAEQTVGARRAKAAGELTTALDHCTRALRLFRGEPLPGLPGPFADTERQRLARQRRTLHEQRAECLVLLGRYTDALDDLMSAPTAEPYDEPLAALRMRALYGSGRQAEALTAYQETRDRLRAELGVEPGEELRRVHQGVLRRDDLLLLGRAARQRAAASAPAQPPARRNELPGDTACLVGREAELALLTAPVPDGAVSVAAVDGTAGVGKTALVVRAAWTLHDQYPDGCLFVDLHAHSAAHESLRPQRALHRLLRAVKGADGDLPDDLDELVTAWRAATSSLRLLLVVDDARSAEQVRPLLPAGPGSRVLVAGRQRLSGLDADLRLTAEPLGTGEAVTLLTRLLGEARAEREPEAAHELARRCGGLPLALRITGARLQNRPSWTLAHLVDRMSDDARRLGELRADDRSVEAAFRMSYDQLAPELRRAFRALGLSPTAGFDPLTPAVMLGRSRDDAEDLLERLVDASLLQQPRPGRYRLHDLVRDHTRRLAAAAPEEAAADRTAVLHLYTAAGRIASDWGPEGFPTGPDVSGSPFPGWLDAAAWLDAAGGELVDVVACAAAVEEHDLACWIAESMVDHLVRQGRFHECRAALQIALRCADVAADQRMPSSLRNCMAIADIYQGRFPAGHAWSADALRLARRQGDLREQARAMAGLGATERAMGRTAEAVAHLSEVVELAARLGDDWLAGMSNCNLGAIFDQQGRHEEALAYYATSLAFAEKIGRPRMISKTLGFAAEAHLALGRHVEARSLLRRAADLAREVADLQLLAVSLSLLGAAEHGQGDLRLAVALHQEALSTLTEHTSTPLEAEVRRRLGNTYAAAGRSAEARQQFHIAHALTGAGPGVPKSVRSQPTRDAPSHSDRQ